MSKPIRVQRKRTKGFKLPENTLCVTRGTKWGNPFTVEKYGLEKSIELFNIFFTGISIYDFPNNAQYDAMESKLFKSFRNSDYLSITDMVIKELVGKNLACFCSTDHSCHADILLDVANS